MSWSLWLPRVQLSFPPYLIFQLAILEESQLVLLFQVVTVDVVEVHLKA